MTTRIAITAGEPAGVGPELLVQLAQHSCTVERVAIADPDLLLSRAQLLDLPLTLRPYQAEQTPQAQPAGTLSILPIPLATPSQPGQLDASNASYVLATLRRAGLGAMNQEFAAVVTAPVHKAIINAAGYAFSGHTEFFAELSQTKKVVMLLVGNKLRVALATTHLPLSQVANAINCEDLEQTARILEQGIRQLFKIKKPRILVCGLNPHAGEDGYLGREEIDIITPVMHKLRQLGIDISDPLPADSLFTPAHLAQADAVLTMYHDQGLPVLKHAAFGRAVNITLGLPFIRTSVDHGTALALAGTGQADPGSFQTALDLAIEFSQSA